MCELSVCELWQWWNAFDDVICPLLNDIDGGDGNTGVIPIGGTIAVGKDPLRMDSIPMMKHPTIVIDEHWTIQVGCCLTLPHT